MKVIILGAGGRGRNYTRYCKQYGVDIVAVADPNTKKLQKLGKDFEISEDKLYSDWKDILEKEKFADAVINATDWPLNIGQKLTNTFFFLVPYILMLFRFFYYT